MNCQNDRRELAVGITHVETNVYEHEPYITPAVAVLNVEALAHELVGRPECTVVALSSSVRVRDISTSDVDEGLQILVARKVVRRVQLNELNGGTVDGLPSDGWCP